MLLMIKKGIREEIRHSIYQYEKANIKYMKIMIKIKNHHIFNIGVYMMYAIGQCRRSFW